MESSSTKVLRQCTFPSIKLRLKLLEIYNVDRHQLRVTIIAAKNDNLII